MNIRQLALVIMKNDAQKPRTARRQHAAPSSLIKRGLRDRLRGSQTHVGGQHLGCLQIDRRPDAAH